MSYANYNSIVSLQVGRTVRTIKGNIGPRILPWGTPSEKVSVVYNIVL